MTHEESTDAGDLSYRERLGETLRKRDSKRFARILDPAGAHVWRQCPGCGHFKPVG